MIVTGVIRKPRRRHVDVYVDGELKLSLSTKLAAEHEIAAGQAITRRKIGELEYEEARRSCLEAAVRLLSHRPRSEKELRQRLRRKGFAKSAIDEAAERLRTVGYIDDDSFARCYTESQQMARPRSGRLLAFELRQKGVAAEIADCATSGVLDDEAAYDAASRRLRAMRGLEYSRFRERLGAFLTRRGFSYDVARRTIERCWVEIETELA